MRLSRTAIITIITILVCLVAASISSASVVTIDVAGKTAKSDSKLLEPFTPQFNGQQAGVCVNNKLEDPQAFTLRCSGLAEPEYDVYVDGASKGSKSAEQLQKGIQFVADGSVCDPGMIRCISNITPRLQKLYDNLRQTKIPDEQFVFNAMQQAIDWTKLTLVEEQSWRSIRIIIAPKDTPLATMEWMQRHSDYDTAGIITNTCWAYQQARDQVYHQVKDPALRNDAVIALTPVDFTAVYSVAKGKPHVTAKLLNNCDLPLSGTASLNLPAGWKAVGGKTKFTALKSGQTYVLSCDLVAASKSAVARKEVPVTLNVIITQLDKSAAMKLSATAKATGK